VQTLNLLDPGLMPYTHINGRGSGVIRADWSARPAYDALANAPK
jgi:hypothetical protein